MQFQLTTLLLIILSACNLLTLAVLLFRSGSRLTHLFHRQEQSLLKTLHEAHMSSDKYLKDNLHEHMRTMQNQVLSILKHNAETIGKEVDKLTQKTEKQLDKISGQVEKRLTEGFQKTNETFTQVIQRLAIIDRAQKEITELSSSVVDLQGILADKKARGAYGEVQLSALVANTIPDAAYSLQHTLSNGKRVDCLLQLPEPTGNVAVDAKFPLESYRQLTETNPTTEQPGIVQQFRKDIKKHIDDIASKYIISGETSDGAVMFIPAEAVFAEIHAHHTDVVEYAQRKKVWLVSPTTMMAVLTTARAVLKDAATRKQVHIIQEHLTYLAKDFSRFQDRMDQLARHIEQAHNDVNKVSTSAKKISSRFERIERVEIDEADVELLE